MVKLTLTGIRLSAFTLAIGALAVIFGDPVLLVTSIILALILLYDYGFVWWEVRGLYKLVRIEPGKLEVRMVAGGSVEQELTVETHLPLRFTINRPWSWCRLELKEFVRGVGRMKLWFEPRLAANYYKDSLEVRVFGRLGLVEAHRLYPITLNVRVYPRVVEAIARVVKMLVSVGRGRIGDQPIELKGRGLEYAESREYVPGDELDRMDWKAMARINRLMVKEFYLEAGSTAHIVYDVRAVSPETADELSTAFLNTALGLAEAGVPFGLTIHDGHRTIIHIPAVNPIEALKVALKHVLETVGVESEPLDLLLDPRTLREARSLLMRIREEPVQKLIKAEVEAYLNALNKPISCLFDYVYEQRIPFEFLVITELGQDVGLILELNDLASVSGGRVRVIHSTKPWLYASSLEEAYELYLKCRRVKDMLEKRRVVVLKSPVKKRSRVL